MSMSIENTAKDIEPHHIPQSTLRQRLQRVTTAHIAETKPHPTMIDALERELKQIPEVDRIPQSVHDVCNVITEQFVNTADTLRRQASNLRLRANQLDIMAKRIDGAAVSVPESLKDWVHLETKYRDAALQLSTVAPDADFE